MKCGLKPRCVETGTRTGGIVDASFERVAPSESLPALRGGRADAFSR